MRAKLVKESLKMFEAENVSMDVNINERDGIATVYLDTMDWETEEIAQQEINKLDSSLIREIEKNLGPYDIDYERLERSKHKAEFIDIYRISGEQHEVWSIEIPVKIQEKRSERKRKRRFFK